MKQSLQSNPLDRQSPVRPSSRGNLPLLTVTAAGLCVLVGVLAVYNAGDAPEGATSPAVALPAQEAAETDPVVAEAAPQDSFEEEVVSRSIVLPMSKTGHGEISLKRNTADGSGDLSSVNANTLVSPKFASFSDVFTPLDAVTSARIKDELRAPTRLLEAKTNKPSISSLTDHSMTLLCPFGSKADPRLKTLVEDAVFQRQSNEYIETLVNNTVKRDKLRVPASLRTTRGDWDTAVLLTGMAQIASGSIDAAWKPHDTSSTYVIQEGDSLASISMQFYGHPFHYKTILKANSQISAKKPVLVPGDELTIPAE